jgi:hypothetical protein
MTVEEIEKEIEHVEKAAESNTDLKMIHGLIAKGVWQIALQLAISNRPTEVVNAEDSSIWNKDRS